MEKRTLRFTCLIEMAKFSKTVSVGYLMNTNNLTLTGKFSDADIELASGKAMGSSFTSNVGSGIGALSSISRQLKAKSVTEIPH